MFQDKIVPGQDCLRQDDFLRKAMDREALTRDRSVARCIAEGYRLFTGQQLTTLRRTWKPLVASSLGWALSITTALCGQWIGTALALLLALAALVVFKRTILQLVAPMP